MQHGLLCNGSRCLGGAPPVKAGLRNRRQPIPLVPRQQFLAPNTNAKAPLLTMPASLTRYPAVMQVAHFRPLGAAWHVAQPLAGSLLQSTTGVGASHCSSCGRATEVVRSAGFAPRRAAQPPCYKGAGNRSFGCGASNCNPAKRAILQGLKVLPSRQC